MEDFDFIGPNDNPALLAISTPEYLLQSKKVLAEMGYKIHSVDSHLQFETRYNQVNYQVVVIEETFAGKPLEENPSLTMLQKLPMSQRRHATVLMIGLGFETLNALQAFSQSVHCVINYSEMAMFADIARKTVTENNLFLTTYREVQHRVYQGGG
jgi:hypothetical protein